MAWRHYYINCRKLFGTDERQEDPCIVYNLNIPPHGGVRREWTTVGMKHGASVILFVEYRMVDDDPDGVWEAFGMKSEPEYSFTVNAGDADPQQLFVYTLYKDGALSRGFDIDTENARAILVFAESRAIAAEQFAAAAQKAEQAPYVAGAVEEIVADELLGGSEDVLCLAFFNR